MAPMWLPGIMYKMMKEDRKYARDESHHSAFVELELELVMEI